MNKKKLEDLWNWFFFVTGIWFGFLWIYTLILVFI
jgi:hypothetical protein